jgi:hypothetical protein
MEANSEPESDAESPPKPNGNLALTLVVFSWCAWMVFQTVQLVRERNHLSQLQTNQESALQEAAKVKAQIDSIAAETAKLAAEGNPNAQRIAAEFKKRGFKVSADIKPATPLAK